MSIIFDQYAERLARLKRKPATRRAFDLAVRDFEQYLTDEGLDPAKVTSLDMEEYLAGRELAPSTKKLHLTHLGAAYRYAQRRGLVEQDPTVDVEVEREPDKEPRIIPNEELRAFKSGLVNDREWMAFHLLAYTGMRRSEVLGLKWADVKLLDNTITVVGKGGKLRHIPIHPALGDVFLERDRPEDGWVLAGQTRAGRQTATSPNTFWHLVHHITQGKYATHDFRRTVASSLYANGVNGDTIDKIMGWSPRVVRTRYYQAIADQQLQRAILKLYRDDPI